MSDVGRSIKEGLGFGLIAGAIFGLCEVLAAVVSGHSPVWVLRLLASVPLGEAALAITPTATVIVVGIATHAWLSAAYGLFYGIYNSALTQPTRAGRARQVAIGMLYGLMLWLVNSQMFARGGFPWLLELPQGIQLVLHTVGFGLPLGLLYGRAEHRVVPAQGSYRYQ